MSSRVSVILPTFNRADLIGETIESIIAQSRPVDEILVVDDGSTDTTREVVEQYQDRVTYVRKENGGKAQALNFGLAHVTGDYIWICDDDDILLADACQRLAGELDGDPQLDFCAGKHEDFTVDEATGERRIKPPGYWRPSKPDELFPDLLDGCHIFQPGLLVRRRHYDAVGPFNEQMVRSQDYEMLLRLSRKGRGKLLGETVFLHREHAGVRGSAKERFSFSEANAKWIKFHRMIMQPLMADLGDHELLPESIWTDPARQSRRARTATLKRGAVYARHLLWEEAVDTWSAASVLDEPFDDFEQALVLGSTQYSLGCDPLFEDQALQERLMGLSRTSDTGRDTVSLITRSVRWRLKAALVNFQVCDVLRISRFLLKVR